ncbi:DUF977 family protein [Escherichia coli]|uniref:DUF977 family protein n=1 Tax=Escherichia coli TaxID=562 RepID=UPI003D814DFC
MAKPFTHEQREELKARIIGLVRKNERMTISQLERATGAGWHSVRRAGGAYGETFYTRTA